ncbi:NitT/TauT family transport system substrate-binding protein [Marinobacter segnicrescens]|uniref:NitT/TauT family transport system substrate-binding protein n=1 Tax=Marinobacter segnicrescens TaxID=430453 RepID=A0A1H9YTS9_9GAMM|nr:MULTISPECIES: ABC transporter substrate-binding protein [Marinobacter]UZD64409.1 ABC transporter substrate-binding protein [Marinobacter sp. AN1]SES72534.1 NitT/TauT family transport system substrate-binding protein [Marinobacter segnicrescens]
MIKRFPPLQRAALATTVCISLMTAGMAAAADLVRVGSFPVASSLPYYVAKDRGYFAEQGIETEEVRLMGGPALLSALISGQIDAAANLVTLEGMNGNLLRAGVATYIAINGQNTEYPMEQYVAHGRLGIETLEELVNVDKRPLRVMSAPGPANMAVARAGLSAVGLTEGQDYILNELAMNLHVEAMLAGTFDLGMTLEPNATVMLGRGNLVAIESGIIANRVIQREGAQAWAAGAALNQAFIDANPDVARRFALAWSKAVDDIANDPGARESLKGNTFTPDDIAATVPLPKFTMIKDLDDQDLADFQTFLDWGTELGLMRQNVAASTFLKDLEN